MERRRFFLAMLGRYRHAKADRSAADSLPEKETVANGHRRMLGTSPTWQYSLRGLLGLTAAVAAYLSLVNLSPHYAVLVALLIAVFFEHRLLNRRKRRYGDEPDRPERPGMLMRTAAALCGAFIGAVVGFVAFMLFATVLGIPRSDVRRIEDTVTLGSVVGTTCGVLFPRAVLWIANFLIA